MKKAKIRSPAKFRKKYEVILNHTPYYSDGVLKFDQNLVYSVLKMLPKSNLDVGRLQLKIPLSDLLLGFKKPSYFLVYVLSSLDHQNRKLYFDLKGITTIANWRLTSRIGKNDSHHHCGLNLRSYVSYHRDTSRITTSLRKTLRIKVSQMLDALGEESVVSIAGKIITGQLNENIRKSLEAIPDVGLSKIKEFLVFEYLPK